MRNEIITGYRPKLVKVEPVKDPIVILNFNIAEGEGDTYTSDSVSLRMSQIDDLPAALENSGIIEAVTIQELLEVLSTLGVEEEKIIEIGKKIILKQIELYDKSPNVNSFSLDGQDIWLDKATRVGLMNSISIEKAHGKEVSTLWFGNQKFEIPVDKAIQMLQVIELYAVECYNVTAKHLLDASNLTSLQEAVRFDITSEYPERIVFQ